MTEQQISDLLYDLKFTDEQCDAFMDMISYAKECQATNNTSNLKPHISDIIDKVISNED